MIIKALIGVCLAIAVSGCSPAPEASSNLEGATSAELAAAQQGSAVRAVCPSPQATDYFFPIAFFYPDKAYMDDLIRESYSSHLSAMREPSLSCEAGVEDYRFTWLRSFDHPVSIHVNVDGSTGTHTLTAIELDGAGGYEPGVEKRRVTTKLSSAQAAELHRALRDERVWELPGKDYVPGADGATWIIELRVGSRYHYLERWSPEDGPIRRLGLMLVSFSGWEFPQVY